MTFPLHDDGEQGPDTDGLGATRLMPPREMEGCTIRFVECGIGHGRLTADNWINEGCPYCRIAAIQARIARKEAANEALVAKLGATLADMRSLQRQNEQWRAECQRLSALLVETQKELARRMAMPANALRHGGGR